jgi:hypothetical protein
VNSAFELPSYIFSAGVDLFRLVSTDPAWFHATLSLIALHQDLNAGREVSRLPLYHKGEALRTVKWRLEYGLDAPDDATVGAVASLVNFDLCMTFLVWLSLTLNRPSSETMPAQRHMLKA